MKFYFIISSILFMMNSVYSQENICRYPVSVSQFLTTGGSINCIIKSDNSLSLEEFLLSDESIDKLDVASTLNLFSDYMDITDVKMTKILLQSVLTIRSFVKTNPNYFTDLDNLDPNLLQDFILNSISN